MRISNSAHESHAWRIDEVAPDFRLVDAWALPAQGGAEDFATLLEVMASLDPTRGASRATSVLFTIRYRVGEWLGWDEPSRPLAIPDAAETTLRARLPEDLRGTTAGVELGGKDFSPPLRHRRGVGGGDLQRNRSRGHAGGVGRCGRRSLPGTDGHICQAAGSARGRVHGGDRAVSPSGRVPGDDAADRTRMGRTHGPAPRRGHLHGARVALQLRARDRSSSSAALEMLCAASSSSARRRASVPTSAPKL